MNDCMRIGMAEAARLTRSGRLAEATATIQRTLGSLPAVNLSGAAEPGRAAPPVEAEFHIIDESPPPTETRLWKRAPRTKLSIEPMMTRPYAVTDALLPDALRLPGGTRNAVGRAHLARPEAISSSIHASGQFINRTYTNTAGKCSYKLYIPSGYTGQALPLLVMLHGCTQTSNDFATGTRMNVLAEKEMFLVAYPEQATTSNSSKCWNWFQATDQHRGAGAPSLIAGITQQVMSAYHVDANRVYIAGLSSGGAMAAIMAMTYPDLYAAVGVHSGLAYGAAHDLPSAFAAMKKGSFQPAHKSAEVIPLIVFHGDRDTTVATVNADCVLDQWLRVASNGSNAKKAMRDAAVEQGQVVGGHTYTHCHYTDASGQVFLEKWIVHQAGHAWSGGSPGGSYTDPRGPDASAEMMRFFIEHPKGR